jgi:hypothetical protein
MSDDESLAREAREAHDLDKATFEAVRADGTLDRLRRRLVDDAYAQVRRAFASLDHLRPDAPPPTARTPPLDPSPARASLTRRSPRPPPAHHPPRISRLTPSSRRFPQADLRQFVADALRTSATLNAPGARRENEKALLDALRAELEERVVAAFSQRAWATMLDESQGLGREIYEAVYVAREGAEAATKTEG